jgi:AraC-like DNA-binding protein
VVSRVRTCLWVWDESYLVSADSVTSRMTWRVVHAHEAPLNRYSLLHSTADLSVRRFDHPPHTEHHDPDLEVAERWAIAFVRAGSFDVIVNGERHRLVEGSVFLTRPGLSFRCAHHESCPDDVCLSIAFEPGAVAGWEHAWARAGWVARAVPTPRVAHAQARLARAVDDAESFELERWSLATLSALAGDSTDDRARGHYAPRRADIDAVVEACLAMDADPTSRRSVADRAREVGFTGASLTHAFRRYLGISPHRYVVRRRLAAGAGLLDEGRSVSESCWRSGFENLSHYCRSFQRALGVRPSTWRRLSSAERRRKVQDMLGMGS